MHTSRFVRNIWRHVAMSAALMLVSISAYSQITTPQAVSPVGGMPLTTGEVLIGSAFSAQGGLIHEASQWQVSESQDELLAPGTVAVDFSEQGFGDLDDQYVEYTLPFPFPFYGRSITAISVNTNGLIELLEDGEVCSDCGFFDTHGDGAHIGFIDAVFAFNDDLVASSLNIFDGGNYVRIEFKGDTFFDDDFDDTTNKLIFEVVLFSDGRVRWHVVKADWKIPSTTLFSGLYAKEDAEEIEVANVPGTPIYAPITFEYDPSAAQDEQISSVFLYDSGDSGDLTAHPPAHLTYGETYFWRVRYVADTGEVSDWSQTAEFSDAEVDAIVSFAVPDIADSSDAEAVIFQDPGLGKPVVVDLGSDTVLQTLSFKRGLEPVDAGQATDLNSDGHGEIAGLLWDPLTAQPVVELRDPVDGAKVKNVKYSAKHEPVALGITGSDSEEAVVLARQAGNDDRGRLLIRNLISKATRVNINLPKKYRVEDLVMAPDFSGNGFGEALVRTTRFSDNKGFILVYDTGVETGGQITKISIPAGQTVISHDYTVGPGGVSAVTVLALRDSDLKPRLYVFDGLTGDRLWGVSKNIGWDPVAVKAYTTPALHRRIAALFQRDSDQRPIVSIFNADTGKLIENVLFKTGQTGVDLTIFPDISLDHAGQPELGVTIDNSGVLKIRLRDSVSKQLVQTLHVP